MVKVERAVAAPEFLDAGNNLIIVSLGAARNVHTERSSIRDATPNALLSGACDTVRIPTPLQANHSCLLASARTKVSDHSAHPPDRLKGRQDAPPVESQHALMSGHLALSKQHAEVICRHLDCFG